MEDNNIDENERKDRFNIWIYIGFIILGILLLILIITIIFNLFKGGNSETIKKVINTNLKSNNPINSVSFPSVNDNSSVSSSLKERNNYMSTIFKTGGFKNRFKKF